MNHARRGAAALLVAILVSTSTGWALLGDIDGSGRVDGADLMILSRLLDSVFGDGRYVEGADLDGSGRIDLADLAILRANFARTGRDSCVWVADTGLGRLVKLSSSTGRTLLTVSGIAAPSRLAADSARGDVWAIAAGGASVVRVSSTGQRLATVTGFSSAVCLAVDPNDGACWVADATPRRLFVLAGGVAGSYDVATGSGSHRVVRDAGYNLGPRSLAIDARRGVVWLARDNPVQILTSVPADYSLSTGTGSHSIFSGVGSARAVAVYPADGSAAVHDYYGNEIVRVDAALSAPVFETSGFPLVDAIAANEADGSLWLTMRASASSGSTTELVHLASDGSEISRRAAGAVTDLGVDASTGEVWITDAGQNSVERLNPSGLPTLQMARFARPGALAVLAGDAVPGAPVVRAVIHPTQAAIGEGVTFFPSVISSANVITRVEWDFDGDGDFDFSSGSAGSTTRAFQTAGIFTPVLRATDAAGLTAVDYAGIVRVGSLSVKLTADRLSGQAPHAVAFTAEAVNPQSTQLANFQFDFDGDGVFDAFQLATARRVTASYTYRSGGQFRASVKLTDVQGRTATGSVELRVSPGRPAVSLSASATRVPAPAQITLSAAASSPDARIVSYRWDRQGDGVADLVTVDRNSARFEYPSEGRFTAKVVVSDSNGATAEATAGIEVTAPPGGSNQPPAGYFDPVPPSGAAPLTVDFVGAAFDPDGRVASYEWRFEGRGLTLLADDAEGASDSFEPESPWARTAESAANGMQSWTDSPGGSYANGSNVSLTSKSVAVSGMTSLVLTFRHKYEFESCCDRGLVELQKDNGTWEELSRFPGSGPASVTEYQPASIGVPLTGSPSAIRLRFRVTSDSSVVRDGWHIDDIALGDGSASGPPPAPDFTSTTTLAARHTYQSAGLFSPTVTLIDDKGASTVLSRLVRVGNAASPDAVATAKPSRGRAPLGVRLSGAGSNAGGGAITRYRWYFDRGVFFDDAEQDAGKWASTGSWGRTTEAASSGRMGWDDSPGGNYQDNADANLTSIPFDLPAAPVVCTLSFFHRYEISYGDLGSVEISTDGGSTWTALKNAQNSSMTYSGTQRELVRQTAPLTQYAGTTGARIRFRFTSNTSYTSKGWSVDDVRIARSEPDLTAPDHDSASLPDAVALLTVPGAYQPVLRIDNSLGGSAEARTNVVVEGADGTGIGRAPTVSFYLSGSSNVPVRKKLTASASDDGRIVRYEWDFDGDGLVDSVSTASNEAYFTYEEPGSYTPTVTVYDNDGNTARASYPMSVTVRFPSVTLRSDPTEGRTPLTVRLVPSVSATSPITSYGYDLAPDNVGGFEISGAGMPPATTVVLTNTGTHYLRVRVTDVYGNTAQSTAYVSVRGQDYPAVALQASVTQGVPPLTVTFTPSVTLGNTDSPIVRCEWDFEGDGVVDRVLTSPTPQSFLYSHGGSFRPTLLVRDQTSRDARGSVPVTLGTPPVSLPSASPSAGPAPLNVVFQAYGRDTDGSIVLYDFDFLGQGNFSGIETTNFDQTTDLTRTRVSKPLQFTYPTPGTYDAVQMVTDNDGLTHTAMVRIEVAAPQLACTLEANPPRGQAPLSTRLLAGFGTDVRAVSYEFDVDGDGVFETRPTSNAVDATFEAAGERVVRVRARSAGGTIATSSAIVRVTGGDLPSVEVSANPASGLAPLDVAFSATAGGRLPIVRYEWDFDGDGIYELSSGSNARQLHVYDVAGTYTPTLRVTDLAGNTARGTATVRAGFGISTLRAAESFDPVAGGTIGIRSVLSSPATITVRIADRSGRTLRHVVRDAPRAAGLHEDRWNGRDDQGNLLPGGAYFYLVDYVAGDRRGTIDLTNSAPPQPRRETPNYELEFDPLENRFVTARYSLTKPAEITVYVVTFDGSAREVVRTIFLREPQTTGQYVVSWDGLLDDGRVADGLRAGGGATGYLMPVFILDLPDNALILSGRPLIGDLSTEPNVFTPMNAYQASNSQTVKLFYSLSKPATVTVKIQTPVGETIRTLTREASAGTRNALEWDGRDEAGLLVHRGAYRLQLEAVDSGGLRSLKQTAVIKVLY